MFQTNTIFNESQRIWKILSKTAQDIDIEQKKKRDYMNSIGVEVISHIFQDPADYLDV